MSKIEEFFEKAVGAGIIPQIPMNYDAVAYKIYTGYLENKVEGLTAERDDRKLEYKGYHTYIHYSATDKVLHGKIEGIKDLVDFESESAVEIENEFHKAVDDYIAFCNEVGKNVEEEK